MRISLPWRKKPAAKTYRPRGTMPTPASISTQLEKVKADFRMGQDSRFQSSLQGVDTQGSGADYHYRLEARWLHMLERARFYHREDPVVSQAVRRLVANVIQTGFNLDVSTGSAELDRRLKDRWNRWSTDPHQCHSEGVFSFWQMERMVLSSMVIDGDVFFVRLQDGSIQPIEAHRVRTPNMSALRGEDGHRRVVHGVEMDKRGRRSRYWIAPESLDPNRPQHTRSKLKPFSAVWHIYDPTRFSQRRGVTALAPVGDYIGIFDDTQYAALIKQQAGAMVAFFHERPESFQDPGETHLGEQSTETIGGFTRNIEGMGPGIEIFGDPGEKLQGFSPDIPGPGFLEHSMLLLTIIAVNLDLPVHVLLLDPSRTNFSGWRGAIEQARMRFREMQKLEIDQFHGPVYRWKVRQWIETDPELADLASQEGVDPYAHTWNPPSFAYLEPLTDASADLLQVRNGLNSPRRIQAARGRDWDVVSTEMVDDNGLAIEKAWNKAQCLMNRCPGLQVSWRECISLPTPDGITVSVTNQGFQGLSEDSTQQQQQGGLMNA